jgi:hypothetical protein
MQNTGLLSKAKVCEKEERKKAHPRSIGLLFAAAFCSLSVSSSFTGPTYLTLMV